MPGPESQSSADSNPLGTDADIQALKELHDAQEARRTAINSGGVEETGRLQALRRLAGEEPADGEKNEAPVEDQEAA
jgi:hypothetical protein